MNTMGERYTMYTNDIKNLIVCDLKYMQIYAITLPSNVSKDQIPHTNDINKWSHLQEIELPQIDSDIGLLLGIDFPYANSPLLVITGPPGTPHVIRIRLGFVA